MYIARPDFVEYVDKLIADQNYSKVEQILLQIDSMHPDYGELQLRLIQVQRFIQAYETGIIDQAHLLEKQGRWQISESMYLGGLSVVPRSRRLREEMTAFMRRNEYAINKLKAEVLINATESLLNNKLVYEELLKIAYKDRRIDYDVQRNNRELSKAAHLLQTYGQSALSQQDYHFAYECLSLANRLAPAPEVQKALDITSEHLISEEKVSSVSKTAESLSIIIKPRRSSKKIQEKESAEPVLLRAYMEAVRAGRLHQAMRYMEMLIQQQPDNKEIKLLKRDLDALVSSKVEVEYDMAVRLYSQGDIEEAVIAWKNILPLNPDNVKLKSDIARAERVLANIKRISKQKMN